MAINLSLGVLNLKFRLNLGFVQLFSVTGDVLKRLSGLLGIIILFLFEILIDLLYFGSVVLLFLFQDVIFLLLLNIIFNLFLENTVSL